MDFFHSIIQSEIIAFPFLWRSCLCYYSYVFKFWQFLFSTNVAHNLLIWSLNCRIKISNIGTDASDIFEDKKIQKKSFLQIFGVFNIFFFEKIRKSYLKAIFPLFFVSKNSRWCLKSISIHGKMLLYYKWRVSYN